MTDHRSSTDPFHRLLAGALREVSAVNVLSLTDRQGDQIATAYQNQRAEQSGLEEVSLIQVYGQLAAQNTSLKLNEVMMTRGEKCWLNRSLEVDGDRYDLWAMWHTPKESAHSITYVEISEILKQLEESLQPLLLG